MGSRRYMRVDCYSPCTLNHGNNSYHAKLLNISLGGALISVECDVLTELHVGDDCNLMFCDNPDLCHARYSCRVTSQNSSKIGVIFQGLQ